MLVEVLNPINPLMQSWCHTPVWALNIWWPILRRKKNIPSGITDRYLWLKSRLCSCHNELSESSTSCVSCPKTLWHAFRKRQVGHLHLLHEIPEYAQRAGLRTAFTLIHCPHLTLLWIESFTYFQWVTLLNYNWNLFKALFLKTLYPHTPALFKMKKDMNRKTSKCCLFPSSSYRVDCWVVLLMSHHMAENSAF